MNKNKITSASLTLAATLALSSIAVADSIDNFNNSWAGQSLDMQRGLDVYSPISNNNILGTHNTFNSEAYTSCNFSVGCRYLDPQQKHSIKDQLRMGARFIELDVHWTTKMESLFSYPKRLLLCHGVCSINDKYATEGFDEIASWLADSNSQDEVIILYIEDHSQNHHGDLYSQLYSRFGDKIYQSNGCNSIPDGLTKADILSAGKQVIVWNDGGCSSNTNMSNLAFTGLGNVNRTWEDQTTLSSIANWWNNNPSDTISSGDVRTLYETGANIVNLDDMVTTDGRIEAAVWSWDNNQPDNWGGAEDCASQWGNGRWNDANCNNAYGYACEDSLGNWAVPYNTGAWNEGAAACATLGGSYQFSVPTNSKANNLLKVAKDSGGFNTVWLNHDDRASESNWHVAGQSTVFSIYKPDAFVFMTGQFQLNSGQSITTKNRHVVMQADGNFVIYNYGNGVIGTALWASGTNWGSNYYVVLQGDGNLVIYDAVGSAKWATGTNPSGATLTLQSDGNLVIYNSSGSPLWASGTN